MSAPHMSFVFSVLRNEWFSRRMIWTVWLAFEIDIVVESGIVMLRPSIDARNEWLRDDTFRSIRQSSGMMSGRTLRECDATGAMMRLWFSGIMIGPPTLSE